MTFLVIWLFVETKRAVDREMKQNGSVKHNLKKERCTYAVISIFFGLSYITRYVKNVYSICLQTHPIYFEEINWIILFFLEGVSIGVLMAFHVANFNHGTLFRTQEKVVSYIAIGPEEFHRFDTQEVENVNLADESCYMIQDGAD